MEQIILALATGLIVGIPLGALGLIRLQQRRPENAPLSTVKPSLEPLSYVPAASQFHGEFRPTEKASVPVM